MEKNKKQLFQNTIMLYIMQFSNYLFAFIVIPYQTRIMGPTFYGKIGFATAMMVYFQLLIDFGFILSATEDVSKNIHNRMKLRRIYTSIIVLKIILSVLALVILLMICLISNQIRENYDLYFLYLIGVIIFSFLPDYLYRGLEIMSEITYRTIFVKGFYTIMIFIFLKKPEQYLLVPIITIIGNLVAVIWANIHVQRKLGIKLTKITINDLKINFKKSATFFLSRIATTIYTATNTIILGFIDQTGRIVGYYTASDKLIGAGKGALAPISDSIYPYMIKYKDFKLIKKILLMLMPIIVTTCIIIFIYAEKICVLLFGSEFVQASSILRAMLPSAIVTLPLYLFGFPTLSSMGLSKYANLSIYFGTAIHIFNLTILYFTGNLNMVSLALLTSVADIMILLYRIYIIYKNRHLLRMD